MPGKNKSTEVPVPVTPVASAPRPNVILRLRHIKPEPRQTSALASYGPSSDQSGLISELETSVANAPASPAADVPQAAYEPSGVERSLREFNRRVRTGETGTSKCCFWDTEPFFTAPVYVPLRLEHDLIHAYGSFCSPECAAAYILNNPDVGSNPYEHLSLLHTVYTPLYMLTSAIQPAPNPRGILERFGGVLSVQDYRSTFRSGRQLQALPRPLVKCVTEVHLVTPRLEGSRVMRGRRKLVSKKIHT